MKTKYSIFILIVLCSVYNCTDKREDIIVDNQKLLYDSTKTADKSFEVTLITTLKFKDTIRYKDLDDFYIVVEKDTLALIMKKEDLNNPAKSHMIEYSTLLKQKQKEFGDNIFIDSVKNYKIINKNFDVNTVKTSDYSISPLIKLWKNDNLIE